MPDDLVAPLRAPTVYDAAIDARIATLWLEDVASQHAREWSDERFFAIARALGEWQGAFSKRASVRRSARHSRRACATHGGSATRRSQRSIANRTRSRTISSKRAGASAPEPTRAGTLVAQAADEEKRAVLAARRRHTRRARVTDVALQG
jgi:hypothetical protein